MPVFAYRCPSCKAETEQFSHSRDAEAPACDVCGETMRKLMSAGTRYKVRADAFFEPFETENIDGNKTVVRSREHMHKLARENGLTVRTNRDGERLI